MDEVDEEGNKTALTVNVTAKLYWWEFEYPDQGIITAQELSCSNWMKKFTLT